MSLDLTDLVSAGRNAPKKKRGRPAGQKSDNTTSLVRTIARAKPKESPWRVEAAVLLIQDTKCQCGCHYTNPVQVLTRFRHRRDGSIHETAKHVAMIRDDIPREYRYIHTTIGACQNCFSSATIRPDGDSRHTDWPELEQDSRFEDEKATVVREYTEFAERAAKETEKENG